VFKFEGRLDLCTLWFLIPLYCIFCHIGDNVSFKFGGVNKHSVCLFVCFICFICLFLSVYICFCLYIIFFFFLFVAMLLFGHNLHCNYGLHVIGVFNVFEHYLSIEIPVFDSRIGLERLHLFDRYFTCKLVLGSVRYEI
jgi:hypothetical protein